VPAEFVALAKAVACHRYEGKWDLMYRVLWRLVQADERQLLKNPADRDVHQLRSLAKAISRDTHKMHAFVRFRQIQPRPGSKREHFVAWFEPEHKIAAYTADFFIKRFNVMDWSIFTPEESIHWDGVRLKVGPGGSKEAVPEHDAHEALWLSYYKSTFNPARLNLKAMQSEMPQKYWKNLPEAVLIEPLSKQASARTEAMLTKPPVNKTKHLFSKIQNE
jgi:DNA polymerase